MKNSKLETYEILNVESNKILERQINNKYNFEAKASAIIGFSSIFFPLIAYLFKQSLNNHWALVLTIIFSLILFIIGIYYLTSVLKASITIIGTNEDELDNLIDKPIDEIRTFLISADKTSIKKNDEILSRLKKRYNISVNLIVTSIVCCTLITIISIFTPNIKTSEMKENKKEEIEEIKKEEKNVESNKVFPVLDTNKVKAVKMEIIPNKKKKRPLK